MEVKVTGRHPGITPHLREYAEEKTHRLERYFDGTHRVEVVMSREGDQSVVELIIAATGRQIVSESRASDLYAAFDTVLDKAEKQLIRHKEKLRGKRHKPEEVVPPSEAEEGGPEDE
jgi:putative sigma-54 modulation protein